MNEDETVAVSVGELLNVFRDLEEYVVSLDRILSRVNSGGDPAILAKYVSDREVFRRVSHARRRVTELLEPVVGVDELDRVAESAYIYSGP